MNKLLRFNFILMIVAMLGLVSYNSSDPTFWVPNHPLAWLQTGREKLLFGI